MQNLDYNELSTFDYTNNAEWVAANGVTALYQVNSLYAPGRSANAWQFTTAGTLQKTFAVPIDISAFTEIALWYKSPYYYSFILQIGLGENAPNDIGTHYIYIRQANTWGQDTWDISGLSNAQLKQVKYITITSMMNKSPTIPVVIALDELVARKPSMLDSVKRNLRELLDGQVVFPNHDGQAYTVPCRIRGGESNIKASPEFIVFASSPAHDDRNFGRADQRRKRKEITINNGEYYWKITTGRWAYVVNLQVDLFAKYEQELDAMNEFLLQTLTPYGALNVAGDIIDCVQIGIPQTWDTQGEQRELRRTYTFELRTWLERTNIVTIPITKTVVFNEEYFDAPTSNLPLNTRTSQSAQSSEQKRPGLYVNEVVE